MGGFVLVVIMFVVLVWFVWNLVGSLSVFNNVIVLFIVVCFCVLGLVMLFCVVVILGCVVWCKVLIWLFDVIEVLVGCGILYFDKMGICIMGCLCVVEWLEGVEF